MQLLRHLPYKTHAFANLVEWKSVFEGRRPVIESQFGRQSGGQSGGQSWGPKWGPKWGAKQPEWGPSDAADLINIVTLPHRHPVIQPARQPATNTMDQPGMQFCQLKPIRQPVIHPASQSRNKRKPAKPTSPAQGMQPATSQANQPSQANSALGIFSFGTFSSGIVIGIISFESLTKDLRFGISG